MNHNNVVLVTGAAGDLGKELCLKFSQLGYAIAALDINGAKIRSLHKEIDIDQKDFLGLAVDVTNYDEVCSSITYIRKQLGRIKVVINNAGGQQTNTLSDTTREKWLADINLNLNAAYYVISAVIPEMIKEGGGNIINIGSVNGLFIYGHPAYSVAKAGLIQLSKFAAIEFGKYGIRTNIICPGTIKTSAWSERIKNNPKIFEELKELYSLKDIATPEDIANLVIFLASPNARMINGSTIIIDGGLTSGISSIISQFTQCEF